MMLFKRKKKLRKFSSGVECYDVTLKHRVKYHYSQFRKFCITSIASAMIMFTFLFIFTSLLEFHYLISFMMAAAISMTTNYTFNKKWAFNNFNPKSLKRQYFEFVIVSFAGFLVNLILLYVLVEFAGFWYLAAQLLIGGTGLPLLFIVNKIWVFNHK